MLTARRRERLEALTAEPQKLGSDASIVIGDARRETARKAVAAAKETFGSLDILINNTGVGNYKTSSTPAPRNTTK